MLTQVKRLLFVLLMGVPLLVSMASTTHENNSLPIGNSDELIHRESVDTKTDCTEKLKVLAFMPEGYENPLLEVIQATWGDVDMVPRSQKQDLSYKMVIIGCRGLDPSYFDDPTSLFKWAFDAGIPVLLLDVEDPHKRKLRRHLPVVFSPLALGMVITAHDQANFYHVEEFIEDPALSNLEEREKDGCSEAATTVTSVPMADDEDMPELDEAYLAYFDYTNNLYDKALLTPNLETSGALPPNGMVYFKFQHDVHYGPFDKTQKAALRTSVTWWGFLNESRQGTNFQYLILEAHNSANPGKVRRDDHWDRGYTTAFYRYEAEPDAANNFWLDLQENKVNKPLTIQIDYAVPGGGYHSWPFTYEPGNFMGKCPKKCDGDCWENRNDSSINKSISLSYMTCPYDGSNIDGSWTDGFTSWGHVKEVPQNGTKTLDLFNASVWQTQAVQTGEAEMATKWKWTLIREWCDGGHFLACTGSFRYRSITYTPPSFYHYWFDFGKLQPKP